MYLGDNWTPADLVKQRKWRAKMFAPEKKAVAKVAAERSALELKVMALEDKVDELKKELDDKRAPWQAVEPLPTCETRVIRLEHIIGVVSKYYDMSTKDIKAQRRTQPFVTPRHVAMYLCRELTMRSFPEIGRHMGGRDHTTILHGCKRIETRMMQEPVLCQEIAELEALFA